MDCQSVLDLLEAVRPDSDDAFEPEFALAAMHVQHCAECTAALDRRETVDAHISDVMANVPVPSELREKLLRLVETRPQGVPQPVPSLSDDKPRMTSEPDASSPSRSARRRWSQSAAIVVASLLVGWTSWWLWSGRNADVSCAKLRAEVPLELAGLADFDGNFEAVLPFGWEDSSSIAVAARAQGLALTASQRHTAALFAFQFPKRGPHAKTGVLAAIPRSRVADPPSATAFAAGSEGYAPRGTQKFELIAWTERETVYLCFVPADSRSTLQALLKTTPT